MSQGLPDSAHKDRFLEELELDKLTDASYCYQMWKKDGNSGKKTIIAQGGDAIHKGAVQISCKVPNDTLPILQKKSGSPRKKPEPD